MSPRIERIGPHTPSVWIYALCDPTTDEPRYIGKTSGHMVDRHRAHIRSAKKGSHLPVHAWIRGVIEAEKALVIKSIELVEAANDWAERERFWISHYRASGTLLLNVTDGGEGLSGLKRSEKHKRLIADALRKGAWFSCGTCSKDFWRKPKDIKAGNNRFCSRSCYAASQAGVSKPVSDVFARKGVAAAAAKRRAQTQCKRGHPLSGENVFLTSGGARGCKECRRLHGIASRRRCHG